MNLIMSALMKMGLALLNEKLIIKLAIMVIEKIISMTSNTLDNEMCAPVLEELRKLV